MVKEESRDIYWCEVCGAVKVDTEFVAGIKTIYPYNSGINTEVTP